MERHEVQQITKTEKVEFGMEMGDRMSDGAGAVSCFIDNQILGEERRRS